MSESIFITNSSINIVVKSNPTITFDNGMVLWLGKEGETFELSTYDWNKILQINAMIRTLGIYKDRYLTDTEIKQKEEQTFSFKFKEFIKKCKQLIHTS